MKKYNFSMCSKLVHFKNFALLYSRVGAEAASKSLPGAVAAKNDAAPQH
jgi:hypothetical protein